jgi:hypothetical protein
VCEWGRPESLGARREGPRAGRRRAWDRALLGWLGFMALLRHLHGLRLDVLDSIRVARKHAHAGGARVLPHHVYAHLAIHGAGDEPSVVAPGQEGHAEDIARVPRLDDALLRVALAPIAHVPDDTRAVIRHLRRVPQAAKGVAEEGEHGEEEGLGIRTRCACRLEPLEPTVPGSCSPRRACRQHCSTRAC